MNIFPVEGNTSAVIPSRVAAAEAQAATSQARAAQNTSTVAQKTELSALEAKNAEPSRERIEEAVNAVNEFLKPINNSIQFSLDEDTGKTVVKVIDLETKDLIRQFPSEEMLAIAKAIDQMKGLLVHQKA